MPSNQGVMDKVSGKDWRWGIIGTGNIAGKFAEDLAHVAGAQKAAVYSRTAENGKAFAKKHGFAQSFDDLDMFLASDAIDVVYIATPHVAHTDQALMAIGAGKPILIEKPITMTADEAKEIDTASRKAGVFAMEALWSRFLPTIQRAKAIVESGALGEIKRAEASLHYFRQYDERDRLFAPELGGGVVHDLGVYPISIANYLLGEAVLQSAKWWPAPNGVNDRAQLNLACGGIPVAISTGFDRGGENSFIIYGSKGTLRIESHFLRSDKITIWDKPKDHVPASRGSFMTRLLYKLGTHGGKRETFPFPGTGLHFQASAVQAALGQGLQSHPAMPLSQSVAVMQIIEQILDRPPEQN